MMLLTKGQILLVDDVQPTFRGAPRARPSFGGSLEAIAAITQTESVRPWHVWAPRLDAMATLEPALELLNSTSARLSQNGQSLIIIGRGLGAWPVLLWLARTSYVPRHVPQVVLLDPYLHSGALSKRGTWLKRWYRTPLGGRVEQPLYQSLRLSESQVFGDLLPGLEISRIRVLETQTKDPEWFTAAGRPWDCDRLAELTDCPVEALTMAEVLTEIGVMIRKLDQGIPLDGRSTREGLLQRLEGGPGRAA